MNQGGQENNRLLLFVYFRILISTGSRDDTFCPFVKQEIEKHKANRQASFSDKKINLVVYFELGYKYYFWICNRFHDHFKGKERMIEIEIN